MNRQKTAQEIEFEKRGKKSKVCVEMLDEDPRDRSWDHEMERYVVPLGNGGRKFSKAPTCQ